MSQIFGLRALIEFCVSLSRLVLWSLAFVSIIWLWFDDLIKSPVFGLSCIFQISLPILIKILDAVLVLYVVVEVLVQKFLFSKDQRMTKSEVKKEQRDQHGTPEVRSARRRFRNDLEASSDAIGVQKATMAFFWNDEVVAIRYILDVAPVPILSAKGVSMPESTRIRTIVRENGRREIEDEAFVLAMISKRPGETVPFELYDQLRNLIHTMYRT